LAWLAGRLEAAASRHAAESEASAEDAESGNGDPE